MFRKQARTTQPRAVVGANSYWRERGMTSLYDLSRGIWQIDQVNGFNQGESLGVGADFLAEGRLTTVGTAGNGVRLRHGIPLNITPPISIVIGCRFISGSVPWSLLRASTTWFGWYGGAGNGEVGSAENNVFDGAVGVGGNGNIAFTSSANSLRCAGASSWAVDSAYTPPTLVDTAYVTLGFSARDINDNPASASFSHFAAFNCQLTDQELQSLAANPWQLFASTERRIWIPQAAVAAGNDALMGQICL